MGNLYFLIVTDAFSKWIEIIPMRNITAAATIEALRGLFARFGLPIHLVSDNGSQLTSAEFAQFTRLNGIRHTTTAPYHPKSNGQAERFVQTFKLAYKAGQGSPSQKIANFLLQYRNTSNATTQQSPAKLMFGRSLRTRLDLLSPYSARPYHPSPTIYQPSRSFPVGQEVWYRDFSVSSKKWDKGRVVARIGNAMYEIQLDLHPHQTVRRHVDQLHQRTLPPETQETGMASHHPRLPVDQPTTGPFAQMDRQHAPWDEQLSPQSAAHTASPTESISAAPREPLESEDVGSSEMPRHTLRPEPSVLRRSPRTTKGIPPKRLDV